MKKSTIFGMAVVLTVILIIAGCTQQMKVKNFGGQMTIDLPKGEKLVEVTWKDDDIWYLTRPMRDDELSEAYKFQESSSFGTMQGTVLINESR